MPNITVVGRVLDAVIGKGISGASVEAWTKSVTHPQLLGKANTNAAGEFELLLDEQAVVVAFGDQQRILEFRIFRSGATLNITTGNSLPITGPSTKIEIKVEVPGPLPKPDPVVTPTPDPTIDPNSAGLTIRGHAFNEAGAAIGGLSVQAIRLLLRSEKPVGRAVTSSDGGYEVICEMISPASPTVVVVLDKEHELARSAPTCVRSGVVTIDVVVTDVQFAGPTEYAQLVEQLKPHLGEVLAGDLTDGDLEILVCATEVPRAHLAALRAAVAMSHGTSIPTAALYAILRTGRAIDRKSLLLQSESVLRGGLSAAIKLRICEEFSTQQIDELIAQLRAMRIDDVLAPASTTGLSALITNAIPDQKLQQRILEAYLAFRGTPDQFWTHTLAGVSGLEDNKTRERLHLVVGLGAITLGHSSLVQALLADSQGSVTSLRDLARLTTEDWNRLLTSHVGDQTVGAPDGIPGGSIEERNHNYASILTQTVADVMPTAAIAAHLGRSGQAVLKSVGELLDQNPELDLSGSSVRNYFTKAGSAVKAPTDTVMKSLETVQRLFKIAPNGPGIASLHDAGFNSAWAIAGETPVALSAKSNGAISLAQATQWQADAVVRSQAMLYMISTYSDNVAGVGTPSTPPPAAAADAASKVTLTELFGPDLLCSCQEFQALDGPWAYFVTLLMFLPSDARAALKERRPDFWELRFSKDNAEGEGRHLGYALEVLENIAIDRQRDLTPGSNVQMWPANQTTWSEDRLAAGVEHPNPDAYSALLTAEFPWSLPFDAAAGEARAFGRLLGVQRFELMEALQNRTGTASDPRNETIAAEYLGLPERSWELITQLQGTALGADLNKAYPVIPDRTKMTVAQLLDRSALNPTDLIALLSTRFVNPPTLPFDKRMGIQSDDDTCNAITATLINVTDDALDRLHRFVRLWHALQWPIPDLDRTIWALSRGALDAAGVTEIAQLARLRKETKVLLEELVTWWSDIDTCVDGTTPSQYTRLFLDEAVTGVTGGAFELDAGLGPVDLKNKSSLRDSIPGIVAGLGVSADDVVLLTSPSDTLDIKSLSRLYREVSLARSLGVDIPAYLALRKLISGDPFKSVRDARAFLAEFERIEASGFSVDELRYLLLDEIPEDALDVPGLTDQDVLEFGRQLRAALITVAADQRAATLCCQRGNVPQAGGFVSATGRRRAGLRHYRTSKF